jgi:hypothetical protein
MKMTSWCFSLLTSQLIRRVHSHAEERKLDSKEKRSNSLPTSPVILVPYSGNGLLSLDKFICVLMFKLLIKRLKNALVNAKIMVFVEMESVYAAKDIQGPTANIRMLTHLASSITS